MKVKGKGLSQLTRASRTTFLVAGGAALERKRDAAFGHTREIPSGTRIKLQPITGGGALGIASDDETSSKPQCHQTWSISCSIPTDRRKADLHIVPRVFF